MSKRKSTTSNKPGRSKASKEGRGTSQRAKGASGTKTQACLDLLLRANGATIEELQKATGWQPHSVRGFLSGKIKKMPTLKLTSEKPDDGHRRYYVKAA
jgi:uncharacterized protein DUF3489